MGGILGTQDVVGFFSITEETEFIVSSIADDVWKAEDEKQVTWLMDLRVGIDYICEYDHCLCPWWVLGININNKNDI